MDLDKLKRYMTFKSESEVYLFFAFARSKDNNLTNSNQITFSEIIRNESEISRKYNKLANLAKHYTDSETNEYFNFYIYCTVNPRDIRKSAINFMKNLLDLLEPHNNEKFILKRLKLFDKRWISSLTKPSSKSGKGNWMLDIDTKGENYFELRNQIESLTRILYESETVNGYHLIIKPCDIRSINKIIPFTVKRDDLFFLEYIRGGMQNGN